jgi:hypothetical protein
MGLAQYKIAMKIDEENTSYMLLEMVDDGHLPEHSLSNLVAVDRLDKILWIAETPVTKNDFYWKIYFDGDRLLAVSGIGELYEIDKASGKILNHKMIK